MTTSSTFTTMDTAKLVAGGAIAFTTAILNTVNVAAAKLATDTALGANLQASVTEHGVVSGGISVGKDMSQKWINELADALKPTPAKADIDPAVAALA